MRGAMITTMNGGGAARSVVNMANNRACAASDFAPDSLQGGVRSSLYPANSRFF